MYLSDINKIEIILKDNVVRCASAMGLFTEKMRKKYQIGNDECWISSKMNNEERRIYNKLREDYNDAEEVYDAFVNNDWR